MSATLLKSPPKPQVLIDALAYYDGGRLYRSGNHFRWSSKASIPSWAHAGRIAAPFSQALKEYFQKGSR